MLSYFLHTGVLADGREELMRELSARMRTRGPDGSGYYGNERFGLAHERLAIMDPEVESSRLYTRKPNTLYARTARFTTSASSRPSMDSQPPKQGQIPRYCSSFTDISDQIS